MNNADIRIRRIRLMIRDLNKEIDRAFDQHISIDIGLVDKTKVRDKSHRYHVELRSDAKNS
jgi:hypothetical protein